MSIVIHHGHPGSYKSFGVLQRHAIPALQEGRTIVTNIRGFDSVEKVEDALGETLPDGAEILNVDTEGREAKEYMARWFHWAPLGAMVIIDEAQAIYPAKRKDFRPENLDYPGGPDQAKADGRPADVFEAFDMHRHYNWDVFLCTPNIGKVHADIRQAAQVAFRHYSMGELLPWKKGRWREVEHDPENSGKAKSHAYGVPKEYKADPVVFKTYQSTKTGKYQSNQGPQSVFKDKRVVAYLSIAGISLVIFVYLAVSIFQRERDLSDFAPAGVESIGPDSVDVRADGSGISRAETGVSPDVGIAGSYDHPIDRPLMHHAHPFADAALRIAGSFNRLYLLHGIDRQGEFSVTQQELAHYGYRVLYLRPCHGQLWWQGEMVQEIYCQRIRIQEPEPLPEPELNTVVEQLAYLGEPAEGRDDGEERPGAGGALETSL